MIPVSMPEIDYSEIAGKKIECPSECGMCCLCQPEILPQEMGFFRNNHPKSVTTSKTPDKHFCITMKKGHGSCSFLNNRRCSIYQNRPTFCRQFPYHFYVGDRISVELDLSCRGAWTGLGNDAVTEATGLAERSERRLNSAIREASQVYREFYGICKEAGVMSDVSTIRMALSANLMKFTDLAYVAKIMDRTLEEPKMDLENLAPDNQFDMKEMEDAARDAALESMSSDDPMSVPIYCDKDWNWNIFMASKDRIVWSVMNDDGDLEEKGSVNPMDIPLKPVEADGAEILAQYISILNGRESFLGNVYYTMDRLDYEDDLANTYYGCMCVTIVDLLWRASMLDHFFHTGMGAEGIREAIIFYDMDRLDAPTIGAFV